jgi:hypothetical protein
MKTLIKTLIVSLVLSSPIILHAASDGLYRWVDEGGNVKYSDHPPTGIEAEFIKFSTGQSHKPATPSKDGEAQPETASNPQLPAKMEVMPAKDPKLCAQAQQNLKALEGARIRISEPDGSKRFLTEEEKEDQRENARKFIDINC